MPVGLAVLAVVCLLTLVTIPMANKRGWFRAEKVTETPVTDTGYIPGLVVSEAALDRKTRTMKGIVTNGTDKTVDNVTITYYVRDNTAAEAGEVAAKVGRLAPHQSAHFESAPMGPSGVEPVLRDITGTVR